MPLPFSETMPKRCLKRCDHSLLIKCIVYHHVCTVFEYNCTYLGFHPLNKKNRMGWTHIGRIFHQQNLATKSAVRDISVESNKGPALDQANYLRVAFERVMQLNAN